ncbi:MAG: PQQ-binding-like beta-propeller repeat protein, partial [Candidatus Thermoplasmatota archaeon]|nr:PQQ-binding-like beta-propeller repeat protein [Candidatus Thermoplasmatota archaeon]
MMIVQSTLIISTTIGSLEKRTNEVGLEGIEERYDETMDVGAFDSRNDLLFIHHSVGYNWLRDGLNSALVKKTYIDERNDIYYGSTVSNDSGRPASLGSTAGDYTDMNHWVLWFNDYLRSLRTHGCANGNNTIIMFKSCYPNSNIVSNGTEPGDPFSSTKTIANYKALYRHYNGTGKTYTKNGYTYEPLETIFEDNPDILFIAVTAPPRHYGSWAGTDAEAQRAREFNNWLKNDWFKSYNERNPDLDNVAVYDLFDLLAYPANHSSNPNRLKKEYGGATGDSHPNTAANENATKDFAGDNDNFIDLAWERFNTTNYSPIWPCFRQDNAHRGKGAFEVNYSKGYPKWNFSTGGDVESSPSISTDGRIIFGSNDNRVRSLHYNGSKEWEFQTEGDVRSSPALDSNGNIYFGSDDNKLYALNPNGTQRWNFSTKDDIRSSPALDSNGNIYFGSDDDKLYALNPNGTQRWNFSTKGDIRSSPALDSNGNIYFGSDDDKLYALKFNGTQRWNFSTGGDIRSSPALDTDGNIYIGSDDSKLYSILPNGSVIWSFKTGGKIQSSPALDTGSKVIFGSMDGKVYAIEPNGTKRWEVSISGTITSSPAIGVGGSVFIGSSDKRLYCLGTVKPSPPRNLTLSSERNNVTLSWTCPFETGGAPLNGYKVLRRILNGSTVLLSTLAQNRTTYTDRSTKRGETYLYWVTVNNTFEGSDPSNEVLFDRTLPTIISDLSDVIATTGDQFHFGANLTDDVKIGVTTVEYWFGIGVHTNTTMTGKNGSYEHSILIPAMSVATLHYILHTSDSRGNWAETSLKNMTVLDNDAPVISDDSSKTTGIYGKSYSFVITVTDNIGTINVSVEHWFGAGNHTNSSLVLSNGTFGLTISIPNGSFYAMYYILHAIDGSSNRANSSQREIPVWDKDCPIFGTESTPKIGTTGDLFVFNISVSDNIAVSNVYVDYWYGSGTHTNVSMTGSGPYTYQITIPSSSIDTLHYILHAVDSSGNWVYTSQKDVTITDNDRPTLGTDNTPSSGTTGDPFSFSISVSDNLGVSSVYVEYWFGTGTHTNVTMSGTGP